jgi:hypothetical protein
VTQHTVSELLMLTADEIDYSAQSIDTLAGLALGGDPYITILALIELSDRSPHRLVEVAQELLDDKSEDDAVRAQSLRLLQRERDIGTERLEMLITGAGPELAAAIQEQLVDSEE